MKGLLAVLVFVSAMLLFGCASAQPEASAAPPVQGAGTAVDKMVLTGPAELPSGKVGKYYEYSYCAPKPAGRQDTCGGITPTSNPKGGKGPYSFYLGTGTGFPPFGLSLNINGLISGTPTAAGRRVFEVCAKDIGGDYDCEDYALEVLGEEGVAGLWELEIDSRMFGPEGSIPAGCAMEQKFWLNLTQNANALGGTATNRLTKTAGCGIWSVDIKTPDKMQVSGTYAAPSIAFSIGTIDFVGTWTGSDIVGTMATCKSPDARCANSGMQQLNWYEGNFTATPAK